MHLLFHYYVILPYKGKGMCRIYHDNTLCNSAKELAETIHTIFDSFSNFLDDIFSATNFKANENSFQVIKNTSLVFCVYFSTFKQALCNWYTAQIRMYKVLKTWGQKTKN